MNVTIGRKSLAHTTIDTHDLARARRLGALSTK